MTNQKSQKQPLKPNSELGKLPPQQVEVEELLLGLFLLFEERFTDYKHRLHIGLFYKDANQKIFEAMLSLNSNGEPINIVTVTKEARRLKTIEAIGGAYAITTLTNPVTYSENMDYLIDVLQDAYIKRGIISTSVEIIEKAYDNFESGKEILNVASTKYRLIEDNSETIKEVTTEDMFYLSVIAAQESKNKGGVLGYPLHITELNHYLFGLQGGFVYVIAARPRVGKSALMKSIILQLALNKVKCKVFSLEMTGPQLMMGMITEACEIDNQRYSLGVVSDSEWTKVNNLKNRLVPYLEIDDKPGITIQYLESRVRRFVKNGGQVIAIDYLQLMKLSREDAKNKLREQEIAYLTGNIKRIAKEYNVPIIELSQLSREVEKRGGEKRPQLSDLRESGSIEQDAEVIIFIQRPEADGVIEDAKGNPLTGIAKLIIAKNRFGPCNDVKVSFTKQLTRYASIMHADNSELDKAIKETQQEIEF